MPSEEYNGMDAHEILAGGKATGGARVVVKDWMGYEVFIVGVISNFINDISSFIRSKEDNIALKPISNAVLSEHAASTLKTAVHDPEAEPNDPLANPKCPAQVSAQSPRGTRRGLFMALFQSLR